MSKCRHGGYAKSPVSGLCYKCKIEKLEAQLAESCEDMRSDYRVCPIAAKLEAQLEAVRKMKVDANQAEIVQTFRDLGARVAITSSVGDGFPDLVVQYRNQSVMWRGIETALVEIKDGSKPPSRRKLTPEQEKFHAVFNCHIVESVKDVYELLEINYQD